MSARGTWGNALLFVSLLAFPCIAADWPQFRGPTHNGVCTDLIITNWTGSVTNPLWRVGVTNAAPGQIQLTVGTANGAPITSNRAAAMEILTATNPVAPFANWTKLTKRASLTNGRVRVDNIDSSAHPKRYFIGREL